MSPARSHDVNADDLRCLLAVARTGRLVSAATLLGVDQTTVKRRLDRLETSLGTRLLDRGVDGWELTAIGREVVSRAAGLDHIVDSVIAATAGGPDALRGTVRVVTPDGFGPTFAAPALARVQAQHPGITVELVTSTSPLSLRGAGYDLAVTVGSAAGSRLPSEVLAPYSVRLYAAPGYLEAHPPIRSVADLDGHPLVFYIDALLRVRELDLAPLLGRMPVRFGSTNAFAQLAATRAGAGIGLLHAFMGEPDPQLVPVLPREVDFRLTFSLSARRDSLEVEAVRVVRDALRREVAERADELVPD